MDDNAQALAFQLFPLCDPERLCLRRYAGIAAQASSLKIQNEA